MKKVSLFLMIIFIPSILLFAEEGSELSNQWDKNSKTGSSSFEVYFDLTDDNTSDLYCDMGFSKTPLSNGNTTPYDGNSIQATWKSIETTAGVTSVNLTASTYAYWHVVVPSKYKISLKATPSSEKVSVTWSYYPYSDGKKAASPTDNTQKDPDPIVSFSKAGRFMGSTEITIDAALKEYSFVDDVFCTLTLVLETN